MSARVIRHVEHTVTLTLHLPYMRLVPHLVSHNTRPSKSKVSIHTHTISYIQRPPSIHHRSRRTRTKPLPNRRDQEYQKGDRHGASQDRHRLGRALPWPLPRTVPRRQRPPPARRALHVRVRPRIRPPLPRPAARGVVVAVVRVRVRVLRGAGRGRVVRLARAGVWAARVLPGVRRAAPAAVVRPVRVCMVRFVRGVPGGGGCGGEGAVVCASASDTRSNR